MKTRYTYLRPLFAGLSILVLAATSASAASVAAISVSGGSSSSGSFSTGWTFTNTSTIYVTDLGVFDSNGGTLSDQTVGLYDTTIAGSLLASTTVTNASPSQVNGGYTAHYAPITTLTLAPGTYFVASTTSGDGFVNKSSTRTTASGITFGTGKAVAGNTALGASYNDYTVIGPAGYFGGTFKFSTTPVPEPSAALLGSLGVLCLLRRRR